MRTLVIAGEYPWPENSGSRMRLMTTVLGLCPLGPTELFSVVPGGRRDFDPPELGGGLEKAEYATYDQEAAGVTDALLRPWLPFGLPLGERPALRTALERFATGTYDLVWYFGLRPWLLVGPWAGAPAVLDLDDLEDQKIRARLSVPEPAGRPATARLRQWMAARYSAEEARRWRRLRDRAAADVQSLVVCSRLDADRLGPQRSAMVAVVPNGYPVVGSHAARRRSDGPPVILFQGTLRYPPNAHAARFLVDEVAPALRALMPDVRIRLVGVTTPALAELADPPAVTFAGQVEDIGAELAHADLVVVPIRFGSGTRVKVIEAFAHRVPVVSTTLGAEGLGAVDGEHLLIADGAEDLARACARLLGDDSLRARLVDAAYELFLTDLQRDRAMESVRGVAREAAAR